MMVKLYLLRTHISVYDPQKNKSIKNKLLDRIINYNRRVVDLD